MAEVIIQHDNPVVSAYLSDIPDDEPLVQRMVYYGCFTRDPKEIAATLIRPKAPKPTYIRDAQSMLIQFAKLLDDDEDEDLSPGCVHTVE